MDSSDIALVIKSMIENGLMNNNYMFFIVFIFILISSRTFLRPLKEAYGALFSKKDAEDLKLNLKEESDATKNSIKDLSMSIENIVNKIENVSKRIDENNSDTQALKNDLNIIKSNLDKIYLEIARFHG